MLQSNQLQLAIGVGGNWNEDHQKLLDAADQRLRVSPYLELRRVTCSFHEGVLTLTGHVSSYYLRQIAQTLLRGLAGVQAIDNRLAVI